MHQPITIAILASAGLWLTSATMAQEPKGGPPGPRRGEVRGEQEAGPMPRGGGPREGRRVPDDRPMPDGPSDDPPRGAPGFGPRGGFERPIVFPPFGAPAHELRRLQQDDPEMHGLVVADDELDRQAFMIAQQLNRAPPEGRDKLRAELAEVVGKHFAARQKRRELQLKRMEEEIQRLRDAIQARNEAREEIVNKRISELTGEVNPLDF